MGSSRPHAALMTRILIDRELSAPSILRLEGNELHYLTRVRRHRAGDGVEIRSASGRCFSAAISLVDQDWAELTVEREIDAGLTVLPIRILISIPKRHLLDDVIRMASEIGVKRICPIIAARTVVKPKGDKLQRWRRIAGESLRQCGRGLPLIIDDITPLTQALKESGAEGTKLFLHPEQGAPLFTERAPFVAPITTVIGPEGGFTDKEIDLAESLGFVRVRLNMPILRIETAAIAAAVLSAALIRPESSQGV